MRHITLRENVLLEGRIKNQNGKWLIDYYIVIPDQKKVFAFRKHYTKGTYELCKSGIRVNELTTLRSRDRAIMKLVEYMNRMLPYLVDYYEIPVGA